MNDRRSESNETTISDHTEMEARARETLSLRQATLEDWLQRIDLLARDVLALLAETRVLREFYDAHLAVEHGVIDFDLHADAVDRLRRAQDAVHTLAVPSEGGR